MQLLALYIMLFIEAETKSPSKTPLNKNNDVCPWTNLQYQTIKSTDLIWFQWKMKKIHKK